MDPLFILLSAGFLSLLVAFACHEFAHGWAAYQLGDPTAKYEGRLTLNPLVHLDLIGSAVILMTLLVSGGQWVMGWARPVRFDPRNLKSEIFDGALIAFAGPAANLSLALVGGLVMRLGLVPEPLAEVLRIFVAVNVAMAIFNLLPVPPLDGWKVAQGFLPRSLAYEMRGLEHRAGMIPLFALLALFYVFGDWILRPPFEFLMRLFTGQ
jgi:Zn-dependent protease